MNNNMHWYVIHTKPKQEQRALLNLQNQGFECFLPVISMEKLRRGVLTVVQEPLFPRYLFVHLDGSAFGRSWGPIRSTLGVTRMVSFGTEPAKLDERIVDALREHSAAGVTQGFFTPGEKLEVSRGPFAGLEAIYQMPDGNSRVMVLIELLSKPTRLAISPADLRRKD